MRVARRRGRWVMSPRVLRCDLDCPTPPLKRGPAPKDGETLSPNWRSTVSDEEIIKALEAGIESGEWIRFDPETMTLDDIPW